jgi:uncharacterized protein YdaU (DUF1376 family)
MPNKPPAFQFYAKDWLVDTARLTLEQEGAFIRLLAHEWVEGHIPADDYERARVLGVGVKKLRFLWRTLGKHFLPGINGGLTNARLEDERRKQSEYRELQSRKGKARHGQA